MITQSSKVTILCWS